VQNYPECTENVKFSALRHFAKRGFCTANTGRFPLPEAGNSLAGFLCKTRDVGQLVLGAAAAAAALFAGKKPTQMLKIHERITRRKKEKIRWKLPKNQNIKENTVEIAQKIML
jgi:hypothetical protein